ncbi:MAG: type II toxin-antitoxin system VapC family toxin [Thermodesulfobacteriota bacterium]
MRFWDTSAIVPLCVAEPASSEVRGILEHDPVLVVWWATRTEVLSALARRAREERRAALARDQARDALEALVGVWSEVTPGERVRETAERLLRVHPLRAGDAFQLAAATVWARGRPRHHSFVAYGDRLRRAAAAEGFDVLPR